MNTIEIYSEFQKQFDEFRGQYGWLDDMIDNTLDTINCILKQAPNRDFFSKFSIFIVCEDHHDGYLCFGNLYREFKNVTYEIIIWEDVFGITKENEQDFEEVFVKEFSPFESPRTEDISEFYKVLIPIIDENET